MASSVTRIVFWLCICVVCTIEVTCETEAVEPAADDMSTLKMLHVLFRHGDKNPGSPYPTDPYTNESYYWPEGWGELNERGKRRSFALGTFLKSRYATFLGSNSCRSDKMYVFSTDVDRTLASAECVLSALCPPADDTEMWNPDLKWQPIPVHTESDQYNTVLMEASCAKYDQDLDNVYKLPGVAALNASFASFYGNVSYYSGSTVNDPISTQKLCDRLNIEYENELELPEWTLEYFPYPMRNISTLSFVFDTYTDELKKLYNGPFFGNVLEHLLASAASLSDMKVYLYAAHDRNLAGVLDTLGLFRPPVIPSYSSSIMIELHELASGQHVVKLFYRHLPDDTTEFQQLIPLTLPNCSTACPLEDFTSIIRPYIPKDWNSECVVGSSAPRYSLFTPMVLLTSLIYSVSFVF